ncbi:MAG: formyltetrahydrofolate deformylase [Myxococcales bacterium]|nr:formyltetrahydrofolate deformylase [Myxococcales bacterium]MCB9532051.1 formyltetrahydrofolate deformylase [Myxococcales bacterium]
MTAILLVSAPDRPGLVAAVSSWIGAHGGNIVQLEQHVDTSTRTFFLRTEWVLDGFDIAAHDIAARFAADVGDRLEMHTRVYAEGAPLRVAIFVSRQAHCLSDLLSRVEAGELRVEVPVVVSNHRELADVAHRHRINFEHIEVEATTKAAAEARQRRVLEQYGVELIVLARYMQVLSSEFVEDWSERVINIHHSFLPAFPGARPYHQAHSRGVKLVGATSHYVTADLDEGPILAQGVVPVSHRDGVAELVRKGRDVERLVLADAVRAHVERRVIVHDGRTVVFG